MSQALDGITIADFSQMMQGPWGTMALGDMGADVIKIEPIGGEYERHLEVAGEMYEGKSPYYLAMNRNKRSIAVDLKDERGTEVVRDIVAESDVVVENFRPGVMEKLGFGYEDVREYNPDIVYASASGYGSSGPYENRPGQDLLIQALSGLMSATGRRDDPPTAAGTFIADQLSALFMALHVVIALYHRDQTGQGQKIEASLLNSLIAGMCQEVAAVANMDREFNRPKSSLSHAQFGAPYGVYETIDGRIAVSLGDLDDFADALEMDGFGEYDSPKDAYEYRDEIHETIETVTRTRETEALLDQLLEADIWAAAVNDLEDMIEDEQIQHNEMILEIEDPDVGSFRTTGFPVDMSETPASVERPPPRVGEHSREVLTELGYDDDLIEMLATDDVIQIHDFRE
ncbi:CaiB/BaiF CoA transferase family protein [Halopenitus sp. H-Gu1]|uniref:CaiB/BaiF CoA transferase family protein n=1 Tax=Halopenitus sp. H-Gu1 TaxID=3242697 RepID=UPI00359CBE7C